MLNLRDRRIRQSLILLYKCLYCSGPQCIRDFFSCRRTNYSLRGDGFNLTLPKFNLQWKKSPFRMWLVNSGTSYLSKFARRPILECIPFAKSESGFLNLDWDLTFHLPDFMKIQSRIAIRTICPR